MEELIKTSKVAFASEYAFMVKAQFFHWNVEGSNFPQYHSLLDTIYSEVQDKLDAFAENIRKIGAYTPASFTRFSMLSQVEDETQVMPAEQMLAELYQDCEKMIQMFQVVYMLAEQNREFGLANFYADRQDAHAKHCWMLRSTLK
jgi:starvation-inducible DNA-binding protein